MGRCRPQRSAAHPWTRCRPQASIASLIHGPNAARLQRSAALLWLARGLWTAESVRYGGFQLRKQKSGRFCDFLRLGTPFRLCKTETGYRAVAHLRFCAADLRLGALKQSPIAKKLQPRPVFCFCAFGMGSRWCGTGARVVGDAWERKQRYGWGGPGVVRGVASFPLSPPFAPKTSEWGCFCPKSTVRCCDLWRRCRRTQGG